MRFRNVSTIFRKDLIDAIKDARVLLALIVPFGIAILYSFMFDDEQPLPESTVAYTQTGSEIPERLQSALDGTMNIRLSAFDSAEDVRQELIDDNATVGLIIPEGFDDALSAGETPQLDLLLPESPGVNANIIAAVLDEVVRDAAAIPPAAMVVPQSVAPDDGSSTNLIDDLGLRRYFILAALMMLVGMVSILAVPIILAEEAEKKTLEALTLIASYVDVVAAKALVGLAYLGIGTGLLLGLTQVWPEDPVLFFGGVILLGIALVGIGLLIGGLFRSANQLNNWGGLILLPIIAPAFITGLWSPGAVQYILEALPVTHGMKLAVNGMSGEALFSNIWLSVVILGAWIAVAYTALVFRLSRLRT